MESDKNTDNKRIFESSELIINPDGSIFHLKLKPHEVADTIFLVGDQGRVSQVSAFFDEVQHQSSNREFVCHTGLYKKKRISVLSTGIGTDNIDIVMNELDALVNIDFKSRMIKPEKKSLNIIRIGTTGALQKNIKVASYILSRKAIGFDGLLNFYLERNKVADVDFEKEFLKYTNWNEKLAKPYVVDADMDLFNKFNNDFIEGVTISAPGFYGPQGRELRLKIIDADINSKIESFRYNNERITNFEMESSAIYGLSKMLDHKAVTVCLAIANRVSKEFLEGYKTEMNKLIKLTLDSIIEED